MQSSVTTIVMRLILIEWLDSHSSWS